MNSPGITRGRRPFLAPIWFAAWLALLAAGVLFAVVRWSIDRAGETTTLILLRHAETDALAAQASRAEPSLSELGRQRAQHLADLLSATQPAALWASDTTRAQETLAPLAERLGMVPQVYEPRAIEALLEQIGKDYLGETLVIVGHSNTLPPLVERLTRGKHQLQWSTLQHDRLLIVTVTRFGPPAVTELRY